jgi:hypothetical protein
MIIEITGAPGAGKSKYLNTVMKAVEDDAFYFSITCFFMSRLKSVFSTRLSKHMSSQMYNLLAILFFVPLVLKNFRIMWMGSVLICKSNNIIHQKIKLLRYLYLKILNHKIANYFPSTLFLFDEGVMHLVYNLFLHRDFIKPRKKDVKFLLSILPSEHSVILITNNLDVTFNQLCKRGHTRLLPVDGDRKKFKNSIRIIEDCLIQKNNVSVISIVQEDCHLQLLKLLDSLKHTLS